MRAQNETDEYGVLGHTSKSLRKPVGRVDHSLAEWAPEPASTSRSGPDDLLFRMIPDIRCRSLQE
jgi:hypothetical protein